VRKKQREIRVGDIIIVEANGDYCLPEWIDGIECVVTEEENIARNIMAISYDFLHDECPRSLGWYVPVQYVVAIIGDVRRETSPKGEYGEPWIVGDDKIFSCRDKKNPIALAFIIYPHDPRIDRAVRCVNLLAGIPYEKFEDAERLLENLKEVK
jgi:hypothetical protein